MLLCLGGSQADVTFAVFDMCDAWIQKRLHPIPMPHAPIEL